MTCWSSWSSDKCEELILTGTAYRDLDLSPGYHGWKPGAYNDWAIPLAHIASLIT